jgi:hypothetical protein
MYYATRSLCVFVLPGVGPGHERVDVLVEVAIGQLGEQIAQISIGFDAVHLACADEAGEAGPVAATFVMSGEECIAAFHGRAADGVFDKVGVDVDMAIVEEQPEAVLTFQHVGHGLTEVGFARDPRGLRLQPGEEFIDQRAGHFLPDSPAVARVRPSDGVLDLVKRGDAQQRLVDDGRWLADVIARISDMPMSRLPELLPWNWASPEASVKAD